jgi:hypothetical protein
MGGFNWIRLASSGGLLRTLELSGYKQIKKCFDVSQPFKENYMMELVKYVIYFKCSSSSCS